MIYFEFPTVTIPHVRRMKSEVLSNGRPHITRTTEETVLYYLTEGRLHLKSNGEDIEMLPGDVCIFGKGEYQEPIEVTECSYYYLHFFGDLNKRELCESEAKVFYSSSQQYFIKSDCNETDKALGNFNLLLLPRRFCISNSPYLKEIMTTIKNGMFNRFIVKTEHYDFKANLKAAELFFYLHLTVSEQMTSNNSGFNEVDARNIIEYLDKNMEKHITAYELKNEFGYSYDHMNRCFKKITGQTIFEYLIQARIKQAQELLCTKKISVTLVAELVGFGNVYHFSAAFKKHTGMTPSEYVKKQKESTQTQKNKKNGK